MKMHKMFALLLVCVLATARIADAAVDIPITTQETEAENESTTWLPDLSLTDETVRETLSAAVLTPTEFELFRKSLEFVQDANCRRDLNTTLWSIVAGAPWAIAMYDATVKSAYGIESAALYQFGHFDECLGQRKLKDADGMEIPVRAKYCLTDVAMDGLTVRNSGTRKPINHTVAHWGACVPASCNASDVATHLQHWLQRRVTVNDKMCQMEANGLHITNSMLAYAIVILFFVFLAVCSTLYHIYLIYATKQHEGMSNTALKNEFLNIALLSFSIIENTKKLFQGSKDQMGLNSINGIKALAMQLILAGHALSFIYGEPVYNTEFINEATKMTTFAFLTNSLLFVDAFLLLSGFLFCRILLAELVRRRGKLNVLVLYAGRYIRLTPAYLAVIGFYMTWFPSMGSGPIWQQRLLREQERCTASWWINILYINNYINTDKFCMFQSWYLSVDSQLFFIAPVVIYLLYKSRKYGLQLLISMAVVTAAIPFVVTFVNKLDPTLLVYSDEMNDLASNFFYMGYYIKTHMRASAYFLGLLVGFLVHLMQEKAIKLPNLFVRLAWLVSVVVGFACMFTVARFYVSPFNLVESTLYAGLHKLGWNLSMAWLVLAVTTDHAGWLQNVLSSRFFAPISRLTYCAYLSNGIVEMYHSSSIRSLNYMNYAILTNDVLSHMLDTFILAFVLCLLFESPIHALERILLRKYGRSERDRTEKRSSQTPSTSEEQMA